MTDVIGDKAAAIFVDVRKLLAKGRTVATQTDLDPNSELLKLFSSSLKSASPAIVREVAWSVLKLAVKSKDDPHGKFRPYTAAKHLLCLGSYPAEGIVPDTSYTMQDIWDGPEVGSGPIGDSDPKTVAQVRKRIAAIAGGYKLDPTGFDANKSAGPLKHITEAVCGRIVEILMDKQQMANLVEKARTLDVSGTGADQPNDSSDGPNKSTAVEWPPHMAGAKTGHHMGIPWLVAPGGATYQRWLARRKHDESGHHLPLWNDRRPFDEELFIVTEAATGHIRVTSLHKDRYIRLLMERFHGHGRWNSGYGPLPILEAIQVRLEQLLVSEKDQLSAAISIAQAVFLGRLILDPRTYKDESTRIRQNRPESPHFKKIWRGWLDTDILHSYRRWLVDIAFTMQSSDIDWNNQSAGSRGRVAAHDVYDIATDLARVAKVGVRRLADLDWSSVLPSLQSIMYEHGHDITLLSTYEAYIRRLSVVVPERTEWWSIYFDFDGSAERSEVWMPRLIPRLILGGNTPKGRIASALWYREALSTRWINAPASDFKGLIRSELTGPISRVASIHGAEYGAHGI